MAFALVVTGHSLGLLHKLDAFSLFQARWAIEVAVLGVMANAVDARYFAPKPPPVIVESTPVPLEPEPMGKAWPA